MYTVNASTVQFLCSLQQNTNKTHYGKKEQHSASMHITLAMVIPTLKLYS